MPANKPTLMFSGKSTVACFLANLNTPTNKPSHVSICKPFLVGFSNLESAEKYQFVKALK